MICFVLLTLPQKYVWAPKTFLPYTNVCFLLLLCLYRANASFLPTNARLSSDCAARPRLQQSSAGSCLISKCCSINAFSIDASIHYHIKGYIWDQQTFDSWILMVLIYCTIPFFIRNKWVKADLKLHLIMHNLGWLLAIKYKPYLRYPLHLSIYEFA